MLDKINKKKQIIQLCNYDQQIIQLCNYDNTQRLHVATYDLQPTLKHIEKYSLASIPSNNTIYNADIYTCDIHHLI